MAAKEAGYGVRVCAILFTSVVAPLVVNVVSQEIKDEGAAPVRVGQPASPPGESSRLGYHAEGANPPAQPWQPPQPVPVISASLSPAAVTQVVARGVGRTPEDALRDALRAALCQAVAAQVDAGTWARDGQALCACVCREGGGLVLGFRDLGAGREWKLTGRWHHREVAVAVDVQAVNARLHAASVASP
jgi:hypothetical protein